MGGNPFVAALLSIVGRLLAQSKNRPPFGRMSSKNKFNREPIFGFHPFIVIIVVGDHNELPAQLNAGVCFNILRELLA